MQFGSIVKKMNFFDKFQNWNINQMHSICWSQRPKQILAKHYFALLKKELHGFKLVAWITTYNTEKLSYMLCTTSYYPKLGASP